MFKGDEPRVVRNPGFLEIENVILASKFENNEGYTCIIPYQNLQEGWMSNCRDERKIRFVSLPLVTR